MLRRWITSYATRSVTAENSKLKRELIELQTTLAAEQSRSRVKDVELAELAAVIARNRERVIAETAVYSNQIAEVEKT